MYKPIAHSLELSQARPSGPMLDTCAIVPILACVFATIVSPLLLYASGPPGNMEVRVENRIFWPAMAAVSVVLALRNRAKLSLPPHIICLLAYLAFAGASVMWAFRPEISFVRFLQQVMIVTSIVLPAMLAARTADIMRGLFLCFAFGSILNVFFVLSNPPSIVAMYKGYPGYFLGKNYLGEFAAAAFLLSLNELLYPGLRRAFGIIFAIVATSLLFLSDSKTAFGLALLVPFLAGFTLIAGKTMRISPAIIIWSIPICYAILSHISGFNMYRLSYMLYGDSTFTGRTVIWDFAQFEIDRRPLLGWGYQSFWLVGPDAPSIVEAPGWVKMMPNSHSGYYDTTLEMGYVGLALLLTFITATVHAIGRVAEREPGRAWALLSLVLFIIIYNFLESMWMRGFEFLWVLFAIVAAEIGRCWPAYGADGHSQHRRLPQPTG